MATDFTSSSRRGFVADLGRLATLMPLAAGLDLSAAGDRRRSSVAPTPPSDWDLSWLERLQGATDRAVFDWPTIGDPADPIVLEIAARYLDGCRAVYGSGGFRPGVVLNIRTNATPAALTDAAWERFALGAEYRVNDPGTGQPARRNPFWRRPANDPAEIPLPTLEELMQQGAIVLVCDFALGHLSKRLATKLGVEPEKVHGELRAAFVPGALAVPSGIFGLARAQNAGCAFIRM